MGFSSRTIAALGLCVSLLITSCSTEPEPGNKASSAVQSEAVKDQMPPQLTIEQANRLIALPAKCIQQNLPYKSGLVVAQESDLQMPKVHHPTFYGCFDWHSAVHGHWVIVYLAKNFPEIEGRDTLIQMISENMMLCSRLT